MNIGFTGSRGGLSDKQIQEITKILIEMGTTEAHHGDCIGADAEFHKICKDLHIKVVIHPPDNDRARAFCNGDLTMVGNKELMYCENGDVQHKPLPYLIRNKNIVNACDKIIACPLTDREELRSGTWATIRYTVKSKKKIFIIPRSK